METPNITTFVVSFPNWFYCAISLSLLGIVFYLGALHHKLKKVTDDFPNVCRALNLISLKLKEKRFFDEHVYASAHSPIRLTAEGEGLLKSSGSDKFVDDNLKELLSKIKDKKPKTAYDVQIIARDIIESLRDDDRFSKFKDFVYNKGLPLEPIFIVMSIYLRDISLPLLNFKKEDIDKHDPDKPKS